MKAEPQLCAESRLFVEYRILVESSFRSLMIFSAFSWFEQFREWKYFCYCLFVDIFTGDDWSNTGVLNIGGRPCRLALGNVCG